MATHSQARYNVYNEDPNEIFHNTTQKVITDQGEQQQIKSLEEHIGNMKE